MKKLLFIALIFVSARSNAQLSVSVGGGISAPLAMSIPKSDKVNWYHVNYTNDQKIKNLIKPCVVFSGGYKFGKLTLGASVAWQTLQFEAQQKGLGRWRRTLEVAYQKSAWAPSLWGVWSFECFYAGLQISAIHNGKEDNFNYTSGPYTGKIYYGAGTLPAIGFKAGYTKGISKKIHAYINGDISYVNGTLHNAVGFFNNGSRFQGDIKASYVYYALTAGISYNFSHK
ncbi:MAG: hypothetical protein EBX40_00465 [Gammaproteobacteria bacterium]|nr:hypothetical protein [Gammaproteobacteria bacterium]